MDIEFCHIVRRLRRIHPAAASLGLCLVVFCSCTTGNDGASEAGYRGWTLPVPQEKVDFTLLDTDGRPFNFREQTDGYVTLLFFGYTYCPDVCPIHMANIGTVLKDFPFEVQEQIKVVFVTTDPERDTPERMRLWLDNFDPDFIGHSSRVLAFTKDNRAHVAYPFGTRQTDWATDLPKLVNERWDTR